GRPARAAIPRAGRSRPAYRRERRPAAGLGHGHALPDQPGDRDFVLLASTGVGDWNRTLPRGTGAVGLALREGRPVWTPDAVTDPRTTRAPETRAALERLEHRAILALPLVAGERVFGALAALGRTGRVYTPDEIRLAQTFVDQAAIALDNARLHSETTRRKW